MSAFTTTRWSLVLRAGRETVGAREALERLCRCYRPPVLAYIRRAGFGPETAEDIAQAFFLRFIEHEYHSHADPQRGRFRTFLLTAVQRFLINERKHAGAQKHGGDVHLRSLDRSVEETVAGDPEYSPEAEFERVWGLTVLDAALRRLHEEAENAGRADWYAHLIEFVADPNARADYSRAATALGVRPNTLAVAVHRFRRRFAELVNDELKQTLSDDKDLDDESRALHSVLTKGASTRRL